MITIVRDFPKNPGKLAAFARHVVTMMTDNAYFPTPPVALSALLAAAVALEEAEADTLTRARGKSATRNDKLVLVKRLLDQLATYVVTIARQHAPELSEAVLTSSGFSKKQTAGQRKWAFSVKQGRSGEVKLRTARAGRGAAYDWQYSTDGVHWSEPKRTNDASTTFPDLTPGTRYLFRVRSFWKNVLSDWSDAIALIVQ
jgi:hypothetical protein